MKPNLSRKRCWGLVRGSCTGDMGGKAGEKVVFKEGWSFHQGGLSAGVPQY